MNKLLKINSLIGQSNYTLKHFFDVGPFDMDRQQGIDFNNGNQYYIMMQLADLYKDEVFLDIGTGAGTSAIALGLNKQNTIYSYDLFINIEAFKIRFCDFKNIYFLNENLISKFISLDNLRLISKAKIIHLDVDPHDGIQELVFYNLLKLSSFNGLLICDDIIFNDGMKKFWSYMSETNKYNLSKYGHETGTGIVDFGQNLTIEF